MDPNVYFLSVPNGDNADKGFHLNLSFIEFIIDAIL